MHIAKRVQEICHVHTSASSIDKGFLLRQLPFYTSYHYLRDKGISMNHIYIWTHMYKKPPLTCCQQCASVSSEHNTGQNSKSIQGQWKTHSSYMQWNSFQLEKNPMAELWIKPGTSWSVGNDITTEPNGQTTRAFTSLKYLSVFRY